MTITLDAVRVLVAQRGDVYHRSVVATSGSTVAKLEALAYPIKNTRRGVWYLDGWVVRPQSTTGTRVTDGFDRASTLTLGTADSGTVWNSPLQGTFGTDGSRAYCPSAVDGDVVTIPCAKNGTLLCGVYGTFAFLPPYSRAGVVLRQDSTSTGKYLLLELFHGEVILYKVSGGVATILATRAGVSAQDGVLHSWTITLTGDILTFALDGSAPGSYTLTGADATQYGNANANATYHGLHLSTGGAALYRAHWDNFSFDSGVYGDRIRWIASDGVPGAGNTTGMLDVTPDWSAAPYASSQGETCELYTVFDPEQIELAAKRALGRMWTLDDTQLLTADNQLNYDLARQFPWLTDAEEVLAMKLQQGDTAAQYRYVRKPNWDVVQSSGTLTLNLRTAVTATDVVLLTTKRTYASQGPFSAGTDTTLAPVDWLVWETLLELYRTPTALRSGALTQDEVAREEAKVGAICRQFRQKYRLRIEGPILRNRGARGFGPGATSSYWGVNR